MKLATSSKRTSTRAISKNRNGVKQKAVMRRSVTADCEMLLLYLGAGAALATVQNRFRRRFARFKLGAHLLDLKRLFLHRCYEGRNFFLLLRDRGLEVIL